MEAAVEKEMKVEKEDLKIKEKKTEQEKRKKQKKKQKKVYIHTCSYRQILYANYPPKKNIKVYQSTYIIIYIIIFITNLNYQTS